MMAQGGTYRVARDHPKPAASPPAFGALRSRCQHHAGVRRLREGAWRSDRRRASIHTDPWCLMGGRRRPLERR